MTPRARLALLATTVVATCAGCPKSEVPRQAVSTTKPAEPIAGQPTVPLPADAHPGDDHRVEVRIATLADPQTGWLRIESIRESAIGAWATGSLTREANKLVIDTEHVEQFSIDVSKLRLDWTHRVVLRIDGRSSELTRKRDPVVHLRRSPAGSWDVVEP